MPTRRVVVAGALAIPLVAWGSPLMAGGDGLFARARGVERRLSWSRAYLIPRDNANSRYTLSFEVPRPAADEVVVLRRGSTSLESNSSGGDDQRWSVSFDVDRATADALAPWLGIAVPERRPLGQGVVASWAAVDGTLIRVTLRNQGSVPVGVIVGGRNRGPRNNQFSFEVTLDGEHLPELEGWDFGGLSTVRMLGPGEELTAEADAAKWARFDAPGRYALRCRYEAELVPGPSFPAWPDRAAAVWDGAWTGEVTLDR